MTAVELSLEDRDQAGRIATLTVSNPGKLNILDARGIAALAKAVDDIAGDERLRLLVLRGAGNKAFIGGADIRVMATLDPASARDFIGALHRACAALRRLPVPVIARIEGYALGAGLEVAAACDLRVAAVDARLGMPEVRVGIPSVIEAALLPRLVGWGRARRLLYTGEIIDGGEAERWGLVDRAVPAAALDAAVEQWVSAILAAGPEAIRLQKALISEWEELGTEAAIERGIDAFARAYETSEPRERMARFLKRNRQ